MKRIIVLFGLMAVVLGLSAQTTIMSQDFESSGGNLPLGWGNITQATDGGWLVGSNSALQSSYWPIPAHTTMVATNDDGCNCNKMNDILFTPTMNLGQYTTVFISADVFFNEGSYNNAVEEGYFVASTDGGATWTTLEQLSGAATWRTVVVDASSVAGDTTVKFGFKYSDDGDWLYGYAIDNVHIYVPVDRDAAMAELDVAPYTLPNAAVDIKGMVKNLGGTAITSIDVNWSVNGGNVNTQSLSSLNIAPLTTYNFTHGTTWTPTALGTYTLKVWTSNVNGQADLVPANDTVTMTVEVENFYQRLPVHEVFTSSTCGPCVAGNANLKTIFDSHQGMFTCVKYQMSWPAPGDPYYTAEGGVRRTYYAVSGVPDMYVDGNNFFPTSYTAQDLEAAYQVPSYLDLQSYHVVDGDSVHVFIDMTSLKDLTGNYRMHVAVVENRTTGNVGNNGETQFYYVMMKMLPDANGTQISSFSTTTPISYKFHQDMSATNVEQMTDLSVLVFVQNNSTKEVLQSTWSTQSATGMEEGDGNGIVNLYPNPSKGGTQVAYQLRSAAHVEVVVMNTLGETVIREDLGTQQAGVQQASFDVSVLSSGLYLVNLVIDDKVYTQKLNVR